MQKVLIQILVLLIASIFLISCQEDDIVEPDALTTFGIRHDKMLSEYEAIALNSTADLPKFSSVVCFKYSLDGSSNQEFTASGTLIDKDWILTAGHNFFVADEQTNPAIPSGITVFTGNNPNEPNRTYKIEKIVFHPTWISINMDFIKANDLCLVKLQQPIEELAPVDLFTSDSEEIESKVWFCGFGDYSNLKGQDPDLLSKKHALENTLDRKISGIQTSINGITYNGGLLAFDFDNPDGTINSLGDNIVNEDETLLGPGNSSKEALELEGSTVKGDSGGPLFVKDGNIWKLAGVLSGGASDPITNHQDGSYGDISIFIRVSNHIDWIRSVIQ